MHNQTLTQSLAELLEISEKSVYRWKTKDHIKLMLLLDKYFTKEDLEEFLKYGVVEKLEIMDFQNYSPKAAEFVLILDSLVKVANDFMRDEDTYIDYLAYALVHDDYIGFLKRKEDFLRFITKPYDIYKNLYPNFDSTDLSEILDQVRYKYPEQQEYNDIILYFIQTDFIPFVKLCSIHQKGHIDLAIKFCIKFNLYKYQSSIDFYDIYHKITNINLDYNQELGYLKFKLNYEKFISEIKTIQEK